MSEAKNQIVISRTLTDIGECSFCGGVLFTFKEKVIQLDSISEKDRTEMRALVIDGESELEKLITEYSVYIEDFETWECEKCGQSDSSPLKGGA